VHRADIVAGRWVAPVVLMPVVLMPVVLMLVVLMLAVLAFAPVAAQQMPPRLAGVIVAPDRRVAIFAFPDGSWTVAGEGDTVGGLTVLRIVPGGADVAADGDRRRLSPVPGPAAVPAAPPVLPVPLPQGPAPQRPERRSRPH